MQYVNVKINFPYAVITLDKVTADRAAIWSVAIEDGKTFIAQDKTYPGNPVDYTVNGALVTYMEIRPWKELAF